MPAITDTRPIGEWRIAFDVVQVSYTEAELAKSESDVVNRLNASGLGNFVVSSDIIRNRVAVVLQEPATADDVQAIAAAIDGVAPLEMVCLDATVVDVRPDPIAPGTPLDVIVLPDTSGTYPPETEVECDGVQFTLGDLRTLTPIAEADAGLRAVVDGWIDSPGAAGWPADGWVVLSENEEHATLVRITDDGLMVIGAEMGRNGWIWAGASGGRPCDVVRRLPDGMGEVIWILDPAVPSPDPTTTELHVLATESVCTGASELGERLLGPQLVETDDAVRIAFAAIPLQGDATCPGNPSTPVTITLQQPLGDRALLDGLSVGALRDVVVSGS